MCIRDSDSISGSGVDAIEEDMMNRLRQVLDIGEGLHTRSLAHIQQRVDNSNLPDDAIVVTVFNPAPRARTEVVAAVIDLPWEGPRPRGQFTLRDAATGEIAPTQLAARKPHWAVVDHAYDAPCMMRSERFIVHFEAQDVPGLGYASYYVDRQGAFAQGTLRSGGAVMDNGVIVAGIENDGTMFLADRKSGASFTSLHYFVDDGEAGHAWMHVRPACDRAVDSRGFPVSIALEEDGPLLARFRVDCHMRVPSGLDENGGDPWQRLDGVGNQASRSDVEKELTITSRFTLRLHAQSVEVETTFENTAECHRLRLMLPTNIEETHHYAESAFDVVERETEFDEDSVWQGAKGVTFPMQRFVDVSDGEEGFAFISQGMREYEVGQDAEGCIAVTLLRAYELNLTTVSYRWEARPEMKLTQSPGFHKFEYRLCPHAGLFDEGGVLEEADNLIAPLEPVQSGVTRGKMPQRHGFLEITPGVVQLSAYKRAENGKGWILRLCNPCEETIPCAVTVPDTITRAKEITLEELPLKKIAVRNGDISLKIPAKKIVTLLLENK